MLAKRQPLRFASARPDAPPHVVPVWHVHEPDEDAIYFETDAESVKVRYVEETGYAAGVADAGNSYSTLRGVLVRGEAEVIEDEAERAPIMQGVMEKFVDGELPDFVEQRYEEVERVGVRLAMDDVTTWDFRKVLGGTEG